MIENHPRPDINPNDLPDLARETLNLVQKEKKL